MISKTILIVTLLSAFVTFVPRIFPFVLVKYRGLPDIVTRFLKYLPMSIIFAMILSSTVIGRVGSFPHIKVQECLVSLLALVVAFRYRHLLLTLFVGIVGMAVLRFLTMR